MAAVCARISKGELTKDAARAEGSDEYQVRDWARDEQFAPAYASARVSQAHALAEQCIAIADGTDDESEARVSALLGAIEDVDEDAKEHIINSLQNVAVQRDRLRLDARKWFTSKIAPKIYGDKLDLTSGGDSLSTLIAGAFSRKS